MHYIICIKFISIVYNYYNDLANKQPKGSYAASNHNHNGVYQPAGSYATTTDTTNIWTAINNTDKLKIVISAGTYTSFPQKDRQITMSVTEPRGGTCIAEIPVIDNSGTSAVGVTVGRNFNSAHTIILYSNRQSQSDVIVYLYSFYRM